MVVVVNVVFVVVAAGENSNIVVLELCFLVVAPLFILWIGCKSFCSVSNADRFTIFVSRSSLTTHHAQEETCHKASSLQSLARCCG